MHVDVEAITRRFDEDLADAEAELRAAQDCVAQAQQRVEELQDLRRGFTRAIERYGEAAVAAGEEVTAPAEAPKRRSRRSRTKAAPQPSAEPSLADACLAVLAEVGRPATTDEIYRALVESGRQVKVDQVRSSLGYLGRAKRIKRVGRALWELQG